jgi:hypothetical protein
MQQRRREHQAQNDRIHRLLTGGRLMLILTSARGRRGRAQAIDGVAHFLVLASRASDIADMSRLGLTDVAC